MAEEKNVKTALMFPNQSNSSTDQPFQTKSSFLNRSNTSTVLLKGRKKRERENSQRNQSCSFFLYRSISSIAISKKKTEEERKLNPNISSLISVSRNVQMVVLTNFPKYGLFATYTTILTYLGRKIKIMFEYEQSPFFKCCLICYILSYDCLNLRSEKTDIPKRITASRCRIWQSCHP
jgi:hypothetical protein